jgi:hypothetical protein
LNRAALWATALIAAELAIAGTVLIYRCIVSEDPTNVAAFWAGIFAASVMGIPAVFRTIVWALKSQPLRPLWSWLTDSRIRRMSDVSRTEIASLAKA